MKTVIITGANGNLGLAVTQKFLEGNYRVIATVAIEEAKKDFQSHKNLQVETVNLVDEAESTTFIQNAIAKHGKLDAALLLVGGFMAGGIATTTGADLKKQFALNFETAYYITRPLFQHMQQNGNGRIVFIGARPAIDAAAGKSLLAYGLTKSLLFKLAEYLNDQAKGTNVTTSVVVPSTLDTVLNRKSMPDVNPSNWVKPAQLADTLEFLVSDVGNALRETVLKVYNNS